jgi:hypothetical protein
MVSASWFTDQFKDSFWEAMSEQISNSDIPLFNNLRDCGALIIRDRSDQELFYLSDSNLDDYLALHLPELVSFDQLRLDGWAEEVIAFSEQNSRHRSSRTYSSTVYTMMLS